MMLTQSLSLRKTLSQNQKRKISLMEVMKIKLGDVESSNDYRSRYRYVADGAIFSILASSGTKIFISLYPIHV